MNIAERVVSLSKSGSSVISLKITDESNPSFLYFSDVSSEDYLKIKDMNRLHIDLHHFYG